MDTSKKYVEMSKEAKKWLSNYFKGKPGDLYVGLSGKIHMVDSNIITDGMLHPDCTPLFRQDQLQEMIFEFFDVVEKIQSIYQFIFTTHKKIGPNNVWMTDDYIMAFTSMEQLRLAFVMEQKFKKVWNDKKKEWIKCQVAQQEG